MIPDSGASAPEPDFGRYTSQVHFELDTWPDDYDCEDDMVETGTTVDDEDDLAALQDACALCDHFYVAELDGENICDYQTHPVPSPDYRGLVLDDDKGVAQVYRFDESDGSFSEDLLDANGTWDSETWIVTFSGEYRFLGDVSFSGELQFPELEDQGALSRRVRGCVRARSPGLSVRRSSPGSGRGRSCRRPLRWGRSPGSS
ncbi:MAG TPA: hypothetical protein QGF58_01645 [Myxococcota bacterium]|nr:hypothetical protein [Myxococcota bacterium]